MSLAPLFESLRNSDTVVIPPGWTQGRATYGGLVGALLQARLEALLGAPRVLRSATVSFVAPVAVGEVTLTAQVLRQGKSVVQAEAQMWQEGRVVAVLLASFGAPRASALAVPGVPAPTFKAPDEGLVLPYIPGVTPEFTQQVDFRWAHGDLPFTASSCAEIGGWMRLKEGGDALSYPDLFLLVDAWPPAVLPLLQGPAPGSSLCWTLEPLQLPEDRGTQDWWQYLARTDYAGDGYGHTQAQIWDDRGRLVAISRQTVVVFA